MGLMLEKLASTAERILRMYGDRVGRSRMRADTTLNKTYKPRGMAIVTGEDLQKVHLVLQDI